MAVRASITAIVTGDRSVGRSTIPPQRWSGVAHVAPAKKSPLTDCGGASMTPCSMPCLLAAKRSGRTRAFAYRLLGRLVERRVVAAAAACRRGTGRKEYAGRKRASAVPRGAGEPAIVVAVRGCTESSLLRRSCRIRSSLDKDGYYVARAQFFYADEDVFFRRRNVRLGSAPAARKGEQVHAIAGQAFWDAKSPSTLLGSSVAKLNPCE